MKTTASFPNFDEIIPRSGTNSVKYDGAEKVFHSRNILPLWVADMDFRCPEPVVEALRERAGHGIFGYTFPPESYFEALVHWMQQRHHQEIRKEWIVFTPGVVSALHLAVQAFTSPGDGIIVQPPVYFPFFSAVTSTRRHLLYNQLLFDGNQYQINWDDLYKKARKGARMLMFCHPHNPVGRCWKEEELREIARICEKFDLLLLSDEIHADLTLPGYHHIPAGTLPGNIRQRIITCTSASKTFNLAGLSTSAILIENPSLKKTFDGLCQQVHIGSGNLFGYIAAEAAFRYGEPWLRELLTYLQGNLNFLIDFFHKRIPLVNVIIPQATYLIWLDFRKLKMTTEELNRFLAEEARIGLNNGTSFGPGGEGFMRLNMACPKKILEEALCRLETAINKRFPEVLFL